jgi:hypothetical protein
MLARFQRWRAYSRALSALLHGTEDGGHRVSPETYRRFQEQARRQAR